MPPGNEKADPNVAVNERQAHEWQMTTDDNYVAYLHKDVFGQHIAEPDLSNPTRSRNERPLDTIRSFEMAAYGKEYSSSEAGETRNQSRQSYRVSRSGPQSTASGMDQYQQYSYGAGAPNATGYTNEDIDEMPRTQSTPMRSVRNYYDQPTAAGYNSKVAAQGYGSPASDNDPGTFPSPPPASVRHQFPPTPPLESPSKNGVKEKKKGIFGKRLSFGKNKV